MPVYDQEILRLTIRAELDDGSKVMNRKTFKADFDAQQTATAVLNALETWTETLYAYVASYVPNTCELTTCNVDVIEWNATESLWEVARNIGTFLPTDTFSSVGGALPNQVAAFVIGTTVRPKTKGRIFVFPFDEPSQDGGVLISAALTALGNFAAQYILDQTIGTGNTLLSGIVRETVNQWYEFQAAKYGDILGTQRRRRKGVGE